MKTLHQAQIHRAERLISAIPDAILKGTTKARLLEQAQHRSPHAKVIVTAERVRHALNLYQQGADDVFLPRLHSASVITRTSEIGLEQGFERLRTEEIASLRLRHEVVPSCGG
jgi:Trk K+ transport system NAD-binding subunit